MFGPKDYIRDANTPDTITDSFSVTNPGTTFTLKIWNGGLEDSTYEMVSASIFQINNVQVVGPSEFNQNTPFVEKQVTLSTQNTISIEVRGKPGGGVRVEIIGVDEQPPVISVSASPGPNGSGWNNTNVVVTFNCQDSTSAISTCPAQQTVSSEGPGQVITGTAVDLAGNSASASITLNIDKTAPVVTINSPQPSEVVSEESITVSGSVNETTSGIGSVHCNGTAATINGSSFTCDVTLVEGDNTITVEAADVAGNTGSAFVDVTLSSTPDTEIPQISSVSPSDGALVNVAVLKVTGTVLDNRSVSSVTANGIAAELTGDSFLALVPLAEGPNTITIVARDQGNNEASVTIQVIRYGIPEVRITTPTDLYWATTTTINVTGTVTPSDATVEVNGISAPVSGGSFTAVGVPLIEGGNILTATATDSSNRVGTASVRVIRDLTPPYLHIDYPADGSVLRQNSVTVTGLVNDITMGTVNAEHTTVIVNGIQATVSNRSFLAESVPLIAGSNVISVSATDRSGNTSTLNITVAYEAIISKPQIRMISGNDQTAVIGEEVPDPLVVELVDASGTPVASKTVIFKVVENNGQIVAPGSLGNAAVIQTDGQGQAEVRWKLGSRAGAGNNVVQAAAVGFEGVMIFTATAIHGTPGQINLDSGNNQYGVAGQQLPRPFVAVVTDAGFNRLRDVPVTFTVTAGNGDFNGQSSITSITDTDGRAVAILTLGPEEGIENNLVEANFPGNTGLPTTFVSSGRIAGDPAQTRISGVVLDNTNIPIEGVTVRIDETNITTQTDDQGQFVIQPAPIGHVDLFVDGSTANRPGSWPTLEYEMTTVSGKDNTVNMPIYLLPIDLPRGIYIDETTGGTLTLDDVPGFSLSIAPGSATFPDGGKKGVVSVTVVHMDKVPMTPNFGQQPRFIVTIQPAGVRFEPPAPLTIPNLDGKAPGQITELYSFDHDLGSFVAIGTGHVSDDGTMIMSDPGVGIIKGGWHCGGDPETQDPAYLLKVTLLPVAPVKAEKEFTATAQGNPTEFVQFTNWRIVDGYEVAAFKDADHCEGDSKCSFKALKPGKLKIQVSLRCTREGQEERIVHSNVLEVEVLPSARVKALSFSNAITVSSDDLVEYRPPHWFDEDDDGSATKVNERRFPVQFVKNSEVIVQLHLIIPGIDKPTPTEVIGKGPDGIEFKANVTIPSQSFVTPPISSCPDPQDQSSCKLLPDRIRYYNPFVITWTVTLEGQPPLDAGRTDNRLYAVYEFPQFATVETVLDIACRTNDGVTDKSTAGTNIWKIFESSKSTGVLRKAFDGFNNPDKVPMVFWGSNQPQDSLVGMLTDPKGDGSCFAWSELLYQALLVHSITSQVYEILSTYTSPDKSDPDSPYDTAAMLFKNWFVQFSPGSAKECRANDFTRIFGKGEYNYLGPKKTAQGNSKPPGSFINHRLVEYNNQFYDPSFGVIYPSSDELAWENSALDGFQILCTDGNTQAKRNESQKEVVFEPK